MSYTIRLKGVWEAAGCLVTTVTREEARELGVGKNDTLVVILVKPPEDVDHLLVMARLSSAVRKALLQGER